MRQFSRPQHVPLFPSWDPYHYKHDERSRVDQNFLALVDSNVDHWNNQLHRVEETHANADLATYRERFQHHGHLLLCNPTRRVSKHVAMAPSHLEMTRGLQHLYQESLKWKLDPSHHGCGTYLSQFIEDIFDQDGQVLDGPVFPDVEFVQPPTDPGRGGRGCRRGHGCRRGRGEPEIHKAVDTKPHPVVHVEHISDINTTQISSFDPSPSTPACSSMPQPQHFSKYIAPSWVDEEVCESYDDMHYRDVAMPLRLSFGSIEF
ncbi:hypothetical protein FXO38_08923 [Capsicum annuum]|nr:hypothetical protein FXO38_08923 [Capsicum annuum]